MIEIPLTNDPEQIFSVRINNLAYDFRVILNSRANNGRGIWSLDISRQGVDILVGLALVSGVNLLEQHNLPISNLFVVNLDNSDQDPTKTNLGSGSKLFILSEEELNNVQTV